MRTRRVDTPAEYEQVKDDYAQQGYEVHEASDRRAVCEASDWGPWYMHVILFFLTAGFGNVLYALYRSMTADRVEVVVRE